MLEFLNDNKGVFTVMTSNDVSQLPPELTRAGRLDATWYFSLPDEKEREEILNIHLRNINPNKIIEKETIHKAAKVLKDYTGAEIELLVKSALRKSYLKKVEENIDDGITYDILMEASSEVIPVAVSSKEQILSLERWATSRALYANEKKEKRTQQVTIKPLF